MQMITVIGSSNCFYHHRELQSASLLHGMV